MYLPLMDFWKKSKLKERRKYVYSKHEHKKLKAGGTGT
jgi:hypothetical protein